MTIFNFYICYDCHSIVLSKIGKRLNQALEGKDAAYILDLGQSNHLPSKLKSIYRQGIMKLFNERE